MNRSRLSAEAQKAAGNRPVFGFKMTGINDRTVSSFGKGSVALAIPHPLASGEKAGNVAAVYLNDAGSVEYLTSSSYHANSGKLLLATNDKRNVRYRPWQTGRSRCELLYNQQ
ncbi:MAG: hypothetical protein PHV18_12335 [Lachnospiraceae bacterium]|nr:hypothetical protein [Lachnospiraceae bacterium]